MRIHFWRDLLGNPKIIHCPNFVACSPMSSLSKEWSNKADKLDGAILMEAPIQKGTAMSIMVNKAPVRIPPKLHGLYQSVFGKEVIHNGRGTGPHLKSKACNQIKGQYQIEEDSRYLLENDKLIFEKYDKFGKVASESHTITGN